MSRPVSGGGQRATDLHGGGLQSAGHAGQSDRRVDLVLSFVRDGLTAFAQALAARPPQEEPLTATRNRGAVMRG